MAFVWSARNFVLIQHESDSLSFQLHLFCAVDAVCVQVIDYVKFFLCVRMYILYPDFGNWDKPSSQFWETQFLLPGELNIVENYIVACIHFNPDTDSCQVPALAQPHPSDVSVKQTWQQHLTYVATRNWVLSFNTEQNKHYWRFRLQKAMKCWSTQVEGKQVTSSLLLLLEIRWISHMYNAMVD